MVINFFIINFDVLTHLYLRSVSTLYSMISWKKLKDISAASIQSNIRRNPSRRNKKCSISNLPWEHKGTYTELLYYCIYTFRIFNQLFANNCEIRTHSRNIESFSCKEVRSVKVKVCLVVNIFSTWAPIWCTNKNREMEFWLH